MIDDINRVNMVGRLTKDSELKYTNSGRPVLGFSIAVNRSVKKGNGYDSAAWFFAVTIWGKRGETLANYLKKGQQVAIEGHLRQDSWDQEGYRRTRTLIELYDSEKIQLIGGKSQDSGSSNGSGNSRGGSGRQPRSPRGSKSTNQGGQSGGMENYVPPSGPINDGYEDDIPF